MMLNRLVALVTGGASGLGKSTVLKLAKENCKVVLADLPSSNGEKIANEIGENVFFAPTDVRSEQEVQNTLDLIKEKYKQLDVIVNCASLHCAHETCNFNKNRPHELNNFVDVIESKVIGSFNTIRLGVSLMADKQVNSPDEQRGVIINVSGLPAYDGQIGQVAIAAADGAISSMTIPLCRDLGKRSIRCVAIAPGLFKTPLTEILPSKLSDVIGKLTPYPKRFGDPDEFASLVWHVIQNPMINGEVIRLDGGLRVFFS